jgi:hypothetical protein
MVARLLLRNKNRQFIWPSFQGFVEEVVPFKLIIGVRLTTIRRQNAEQRATPTPSYNPIDHDLHHTYAKGKVALEVAPRLGSMTFLARGLAVVGSSMESKYPLSLYKAFIKNVCDVRRLEVPLDLLAPKTKQDTIGNIP